MYEKYLLQKKTTFVSLIKYIQIRRIGGVWIQTTNKQSQVIPFLINRRRDCKEKVFIGISVASKWWRFSILSSLSSCQWIFRKVSVVFLSPFIVAVVLLLDCDVFYWLLKLVPRFIFIFWFCLWLLPWERRRYGSVPACWFDTRGGKSSSFGGR